MVTSVDTSWLSVRAKAEQLRSSLLLAGKANQSFRALPRWFEAVPSFAEIIGHTQVGHEGVIEALERWVINEDLPEVAGMILEDIHELIDDVAISG